VGLPGRARRIGEVFGRNQQCVWFGGSRLAVLLVQEA
jgi:hypothetical protein